jgi:ataxia telangiectasia mutated family protein
LTSLELQVKASSRRQTAELQSKHETAAKELQADTDAVQEHEKTTRLYIQQALKMYGKSLASTDAFNDTLTRLVTLWMEHSEEQSVQSIMSTFLQTKIASWKFVFLGPQLAARLHMLPPGIASQFQDLLNGLMLRLAREHPYQILYQVITLSHGHQLGKKKTYDTATGRGMAAAAILEQLATTPEQDNRVSVQKVTRDMRLFATASVKWCTSKPPEEPKNARGEISLPSSCPLLALRRLQIPVATQSVKIDPTSHYANVPTLVRYTSKFRIAGGLSRPSILTCIDTEDRVHTQLVSGKVIFN